MHTDKQLDQISKRLEVCLVAPPFAPLWWPPLGVCLLSAALKNAGLSCKVHYAKHWFARHIGLGLHELIIKYVSQESGLCEWIFSRAARRIISHSRKVVACSSSYQQNCAGLALLRQVKELDPNITTLMGGSNCEAEMGLALKQEFDWVDYVISGEADLAFPMLCKKVLRKQPGPNPGELPPGVFGRDNLPDLI